MVNTILPQYCHNVLPRVLYANQYRTRKKTPLHKHAKCAAELKETIAEDRRIDTVLNGGEELIAAEVCIHSVAAAEYGRLEQFGILTYTLRVLIKPRPVFMTHFSEIACSQSVAGETRVGGCVVHPHPVRRHRRVGDDRWSGATDFYKSHIGRCQPIVRNL